MSKIDIGTVLNKFDDTVDELTTQTKMYGIRFITEDGRTREIAQARKNVKSPKQSLLHKPKGKTLFNLKATGTMLLLDCQTEETKSLKVACIYAFKDYKSKVWNDVFH